jgi:quercetin dioxygenase-like cupin family protein
MAHKETIKAGKVFQMKTDVVHQIMNASGKVGLTIYD